MRTKEELSQLLRDSLNGPIWDNLKRALLGTELIEYGATVLYNNDLAYDQFYRNLFPDTADLKGLIYLGQAYEVPFTDFVPSYVRLTLPFDDDVVYPPFSIVLSAGAVTFTNITYVQSSKAANKIGENDRIITTNLYQGKVDCLATPGVSVDSISQSLGYRNITTIGSSVYRVDLDVQDKNQYFKLVRTAIPESLQAFVQSGNSLIPFTLRNPLNEQADVWNYRLMKGYENTMNFYFSDGTKGRAYTADGSKFLVYFLEATFQDYKDAKKSLDLNGYVDPEGWEDGIISEYAGTETSLVNARESIRYNLAKKSVVATKDQVRMLVNTHPNVYDSNVVHGTIDNEVNIYVKPRSYSEFETYSDIKEELRMYGELVTTYVVENGQEVGVEILLQTYDNIIDDVRNQIVAFLEIECSREKLPYRAPLSIGYVATLVSGFTPIGVQVRLRMEEALYGQDDIIMVIRPQRGSIRIITAADDTYAWDSEGYIYAYTKEIEIVLTEALKFGDMFLSRKNQGNELMWIMDHTLNHVVEGSPTDVGIMAYRRYKKYQDQLIISQYNDFDQRYEYRIYEIGREFLEGEFSIMRNSNPVVMPIRPNNAEGFIKCLTYNPDPALGDGDLLERGIFMGTGILNIELEPIAESDPLYRTQYYALETSSGEAFNYAVGYSYNTNVYGHGIAGTIISNTYVGWIYTGYFDPGDPLKERYMGHFIDTNIQVGGVATAQWLYLDSIFGNPGDTSKIDKTETLEKFGLDTSMWITTSIAPQAGAQAKYKLYWYWKGAINGSDEMWRVVPSGVLWRLTDVDTSFPPNPDYVPSDEFEYPVEVLAAETKTIYYKTELGAPGRYCVIKATLQGLEPPLVELVAIHGEKKEQLAYAGSVSYEQKKVNFKDPSKFADMILRYESTESLEGLSDDHYPTVTNVEWVEY